MRSSASRTHCRTKGRVRCAPARGVPGAGRVRIRVARSMFDCPRARQSLPGRPRLPHPACPPWLARATRGTSRGPLARKGPCPIERSGACTSANERTHRPLRSLIGGSSPSPSPNRKVRSSLHSHSFILNPYLLRRSHRPGLMRPVRGY